MLACMADADIRALILQVQHEVLDAVAKCETEVIRLHGTVRLNEQACLSRHETAQRDLQRIDSDVKSAKSDVTKTGETQVSAVIAERDRLLASQQHWVRYVITAVVGFIIGGGLLALGRTLK